MNTTQKQNNSNCICHQPQVNVVNFKTALVGIDHIAGRFGEVSIYTCVHCDTLWLHYFMETDFSNSGRWYRGLLASEFIPNLTPINAATYLEQLDYYYFGGSYFNSAGAKGSGLLKLS